MTSVESLIGNVCEVFRSNNLLKDVEFLCEFPGKKHDLPLRFPIVSIGVDKLTVSPIEDATRLDFGKSPTKVRLKLNICVPHTDSGHLCYNVLDRIMTVSTNLLYRYTINSVDIGEMSYSSSIAGLVIPLYFTLSIGHAY
jgi:hypothetical protein